MNQIFRLLYLYLFGRFRSAVSVTEACRTPFRCWFTDLDVLFHMNNGKYFSLMDLARVDYLIRTGLVKEVRRRGWYPVVVAETARFFKSVELFQSFEIETKVIGWDEKAVLLQQTFLNGETVFCQAVVRARFLKKKGGKVTIQEMLDAGLITELGSPLETWIEAWNRQQALSPAEEQVA